MIRNAVIDDAGNYRYHLARTWDSRKDRCCFIMLNPSTANANVDDPTIRRCRGFASAWGYGGFDVVNLFAFRATNPKKLLWAFDPVGPENDRHILQHAGNNIIAAWGANPMAKARGIIVCDMLKPKQI